MVYMLCLCGPRASTGGLVAGHATKQQPRVVFPWRDVVHRHRGVLPGSHGDHGGN